MTGETQGNVSWKRISAVVMLYNYTVYIENVSGD